MPRIDNDVKLDFKDVLIRPKRSTIRSRNDVNLVREYTFCNSKHKYRGIPIMAANMDTVGTFSVAQEMSKNQLFTAMDKHIPVSEWIEYSKKYPDNLEHLAVSSGISDKDASKLDELLTALPQINFICIDVANGYTEYFVEFIKKVRKNYPTKTIIAGNVVTGEMVEELILVGADIVKVGIGPGSVCTTRIKTGVGYPQLSAVIECADAAHGLGGHIISDGGCVCPGDIAKAYGAGADFVMLGGMLAGHEESGGTTVERDGKKYKQFYGMSSKTAMDKHTGGMNDYRAAEGKCVEVPYKGNIQTTIQDVLGGLRSSCTYVGASQLKELSKRTTFIRVTQQANEVFSGKK